MNVKHLLLTAREIAGAMSYLHDEDILHSDLTGGNILLGTSNKDERGYTALVSLLLDSDVQEPCCAVRSMQFFCCGHQACC